MSFSAAVVRPSLDHNNFSNALQCPVTLTPLRDAVMLIPCGHTISEIAANNIYHGMCNVNGSETVETQDPCPLCRRIVKAYYPNLSMRSLVEISLGINLEAALPMISATVPDDEEINLDAIPFPGLGAKFVLDHGDWSISDDGRSGNLVRQLSFVSQTKGSFFTAMEVFGYRNGSIAIRVGFKQGDRTVADYLSKSGICIGSFEISLGAFRSNISNHKLLFRILAKHNEIPADKFLLIRDLVANGNWNHVTPFAAGQSLPPRDPIDDFEIGGWARFDD